jgi:hypothetical protein
MDRAPPPPDAIFPVKVESVITADEPVPETNKAPPNFAVLFSKTQLFITASAFVSPNPNETAPPP